MSDWGINKKIKLLFALCVVLFMLLGMGLVANAQVIYNIQTDLSDNTTVAAGNVLGQPFTGVAGNLQSVSYAVKSLGFGGGNPTTYRLRNIRECDDLGMSLNCTRTDFSVDLQFTLTNSCEVQTWDIPDNNIIGFALEADKYYKVEAARLTFTEVAFACGSNSNPLPDSEFSSSDPSFDSYMVFETDSGVISASSSSVTSINFNTRFTDLSITGTSTAIDFDIEYLLDTSEFLATNRPDAINISILTDGFLGDQQVDTVQRFILPLTNGTSSKILTSNYNHSDGNYIAFINFFNLNSNTITFNETGIIASYTIAGGILDSFSIDTISNGTNISNVNQYQDCSLTNIYGCLVNALIFTFVPESNTFDRFVDLYEVVETKPPFGYVTGILDDLSGINTSSTPAFDLSNIPFISAIFDPLKLLLGIGLWVIYAFFFMGRLSKIDI